MPYYAGRGRRWISSAIVWILKNKKYIGVYTFEDITISDAIPAIVSKDLFDRAQTRLGYNKHHVSRHRVNYLLSGRMYCGFCGRAMTGKSGTSHTGARYHYYVCRNKQCHQKKFRSESLEKLILDSTVRQMLNPSKFDIIADHCIELYRKEMQNDEMLTVFQNQLKDATIKHANIMKAIEADIITDGIKQRLDELEQNIRHLEVKIYNRRADHKPDLTKAQIIYLLKHYYDHREDETFYSRIIDGFVYKIFIHEKVICLTYNLAESCDELVRHDVDIVLDGSPTDEYGAPFM